jgi:hypothetical protein
MTEAEKRVQIEMIEEVSYSYSFTLERFIELVGLEPGATRAEAIAKFREIEEGGDLEGLVDVMLDHYYTTYDRTWKTND